jgi:hypothetical protein
MRPNTPEVNERHPQLLRDAFGVLDRYGVKIANRDPTKSLDEDGCDLLRRVRMAMDPLILDGTVKRADIAELAKQLDEVLATECIIVPSSAPRMDMGR